MIRLRPPRLLRKRSPWTVEATALFAAMTVQPTIGRKKLINDAIVVLKAADVWTRLDYLHVYAAHDAQAARLNWKNPATFAAALVNAPTFTADRGYAGNGTNSYVDTGYNPATAGGLYTQNNASFSNWSTDASSQATSSGGFYNGTNGTTLGPNNGGNATFRNNSASFDQTAVPSGAGLYSTNRPDANGYSSYRNGALLGSYVRASTAVVSGNFRIGSIGDAFAFSVRQIAMSAAGGNRTADQEARLYSAFLPYMQGVGVA